MEYLITFAACTDKGSRSINEDTIRVFQHSGKNGCVLCDGLGGMGMGDTASQLVVDVFQDLFYKEENPARFLPMAFQAAQDVLTAEQRRRHAEEKMKTTAVALVMDKKKAYIGHIGDSRLYVFHDGKIVKRTLDHSVPQMLALTGEIDESEIRHHKNRSIILKTLGIEWETPMYEIMKPIPLSKCDAFLLCSDGFWEMIEDEEMCSCLTGTWDPDNWLDRMLEKVHERGRGTNMDNYSAIAVRVLKG